MKRVFSVAVLLFLLLAGPAWANDYIIGDGDILDISVWGVRDLSFAAIVRPDGKITVPGLGEVVATGKAPNQLQTELAQGLKALVKNPIVTVSVREITNNQVHIFGGGVTSGVFDLSRKGMLGGKPILDSDDDDVARKGDARNHVRVRRAR